ncbi:AI-2E family transporter [Salinifilum aidingensis]
MSEEPPGNAAAELPRPLRIAAALCWRLLVIAGAVYVLARVLSSLYVVVIPVAIALLLAALLEPLVSLLNRARIPRPLGTAIALVAGVSAVGGVLTFVINQFIVGFGDLQAQVLRSLATLRAWVTTGPLHLNQRQIDDLVQQARIWLENNQEWLTSGALSTAGTFGQFLTGLILALFTLIFFLYDGRGVWTFLLRLAPGEVRGRVDLAGRRGFGSLVGFVRATLLVACIDSIGIGIGLAVLNVPLAVPLAALVFLGAFVPIIGAVASGTVAVLVALVTKGWLVAVIVLGVVLLVQQLEGNVLQPLLLGRAVRIHALGVVLAISVGVVIAGIVGALLAVPVVAVLNSAVRSLTSGEESPDPTAPPEPAGASTGPADGDPEEPPADPAR